MPIIYRKSTKGTSEIETRQYRLPPRARSALILVDGKRDEPALKALMTQQADEILAMLLEQGFIEPAGESVAPAAPQPVTPAAPVPPAAPAPGPDFSNRRRAAVRELNDILGPAGEALAMRLERAGDEAQLRPLLQLAAQVIASARGRSAGEAYLARHAV